MEKLPEFEKDDRFKMNMATKICCRMGGKKKFADSDIDGKFLEVRDGYSKTVSCCGS